MGWNLQLNGIGKMSNLLPSTLGVAIFSFDRPDYFSQMMNSLEVQTDLEDIVFYLFQDGAINKFSGILRGDPDRINQCLERFNDSSLSNREVIYHKDNVGIAINRFTAWNHVFERHKYLVTIEDDCILSPHYMRLMKLLLRQFEYEPEIGIVGSGDMSLCLFEDNEKYLDAVCEPKATLWRFGTWRERWEKIKPFYMEYYDLVRDCDYRLRPHEKILQFYRLHEWNSAITSSDGGRWMAIRRAGYKDLTMVVNRSRNIGERGVHQTPDLFKSLRLDKVKLIDYPQDEEIERWRVVDYPLDKQ